MMSRPRVVALRIAAVISVAVLLWGCVALVQLHRVLSASWELKELRWSEFFGTYKYKGSDQPLCEAFGPAKIMVGFNGTRFIYRPVTPSGDALIPKSSGRHYFMWSEKPVAGKWVLLDIGWGPDALPSEDISWYYQLPRDLLSAEQEAKEQEFRRNNDEPWAVDIVPEEEGSLGRTPESVKDRTGAR